MNKKTYSFLQKKMGGLEKDLFDASKDKDINVAHYFSHFIPYLSIGLRYLFYGTLEMITKFFVFLTKNPIDAYKIMVAPIEKLELEEHELKEHQDYKDFIEVHKKTKLFSLRAIGVAVVAVVVTSVIISVLVPAGEKALGASYTWTQSSWLGGATVNTTLHPDTGSWNQYTSTTTGMLAQNTITLVPTDLTFTDKKDPTGNPAGTSGGDFDQGYCEDGCINNVQTNNSRIRPSGEIVIESVFMCGESMLTDVDGNRYNTVEIPTVPPQCWMAENLNTGPIGNVVNNDGISQKLCYNDISSNCTIYGGLYFWSEAMQNATGEGAQGACPLGWHIPTRAEWYTLESYYWTQGGGGGNCNANRYSEIQGECFPSGTDLKVGGSSGFDWLMSGHKRISLYSGENTKGWVWTSSTQNNLGVWPYAVSTHVSSGGVTLFGGYHPFWYSFPIRCLKD